MFIKLAEVVGDHSISIVVLRMQEVIKTLANPEELKTKRSEAVPVPIQTVGADP
jgi:hypothetical protein